MNGTPRKGPSRQDNPYATCWTRPDAIPFVAPGDLKVDELIEQWQQLGRRGAIIGPHGVGKSTLLLAIENMLRAQGQTIKRITYTSAVRRHRLDAPSIGENVDPEATASKRCRRNGDLSQRVLLMDGYEQLSSLQRHWLSLRCRRQGIGLLVTSHQPTNLPTLAELSPRLAHVLRLHRLLTRDLPSLVSEQQVVTSYHRHHGQVRDIWFDLYDQHERQAARQRRVANEAAVVAVG